MPPTIKEGPWNETLEQWPIIVDKGDGYKEVVLVYLTAPPTRPFKGDRVRTVGRFYKIWADTDMDGRVRDYLVFVGRSAVINDKRTKADNAATDNSASGRRTPT